MGGRQGRARGECRGRPRASPLARKGKFRRQCHKEMRHDIRRGRRAGWHGACPYNRTQFAAWEEGKGGHGANVGAGPVPARLPERANSGDNDLEKCGTTYAVPARLPERANSGDNAMKKWARHTPWPACGLARGLPLQSHPIRRMGGRQGPAPTVAHNSPHGRKARGLPLQSHLLRRMGPAPTVRRGRFPRTHQLMRRRSFPISSAWARSAEELRRSSVQRSGLLRIYSTTY